MSRKVSSVLLLPLAFLLISSLAFAREPMRCEGKAHFGTGKGINCCKRECPSSARFFPENLREMRLELFSEDGGFLGVMLEELTPQLREYFEVPDTVGVLVKGVKKDSSAEKAGIKAGDVILEIDGKKVSHVGKAQRLVRKKDAGDEVSVLASRKGSKKEFKAKLDKAPGILDESLERVKMIKRIRGSEDNVLPREWPELEPELKKELKSLREEVNKLREEVKNLKSKT